jgi:hypothetical protein
MMKSFSKWTIEEVENRFQIIPTNKSNTLNNWLTETYAPSQEEEKLLDELCEKLQNRVWDWNEEELKVFFIGLLLHMTNFDQENYRSFLEREISVSYENETLAGTVDFVVAQGRRSPVKPFFFINEYKKEQEPPNDPLGQLMIAMFAARQLNNDDNPVYGAYVMGRHWYFVVLEGLNYAVSLGHNAAKIDELRNILGILKNTKNIIENIISGTTRAI